MDRTRRRFVPVLAFAAYGVLTLAAFVRFLPEIGRAYLHDAGDPGLNSWILWWNSSVVPFSAGWWNAPAFFPLTGVTTFTELLVGLWPLASPILWATGNSVLTYNVVFLLAFPLSALSAYLLADELTGGDALASFAAGVAYGFAPYRVSQIPHLQVLAAFWMPLVLLALHRYLRTREVRWLVLLGAAWIGQALTNGYFFLYFGVLTGAWLVWFASRREHWPALLRIGATLAACTLIVAPVFLTYRAVHASYGITRAIAEIRSFSATPASFLTAGPFVALWSWLYLDPRAEVELFPGIVLPSIVLAGAAAAIRRQGRGARLGRLRLVLAVIGVTAALVTLAILIAGGRQFELGALGTVSIRRLRKPVAVMIVAFAILAGLDERCRRIIRERSALLFYTLAGLASAAACLGPDSALWRKWFAVPAPYAILLHLPGVQALRVPTRFWMIALVCLSASAALCLARVLPVRRPWRAAAAVLIAAGLAADGWPSPRLPIAQAATHPSCPSDPDARAVAFLQLPLGAVMDDVAAMSRARARGLPSINGYSGYVTPSYRQVEARLVQLDSSVFDDLTTQGPIEVAVDTSLDRDGRYLRFVRSRRGVSELAGCGEPVRVFVVRR